MPGLKARAGPGMRMAALARILDTGWEREDGVGNYAEGDDGSMWTPGKALWGSTQWGLTQGCSGGGHGLWSPPESPAVPFIS